MNWSEIQHTQGIASEHFEFDFSVVSTQMCKQLRTAVAAAAAFAATTTPSTHWTDAPQPPGQTELFS